MVAKLDSAGPVPIVVSESVTNVMWLMLNCTGLPCRFVTVQVPEESDCPELDNAKVTVKSAGSGTGKPPTPVADPHDAEPEVTVYPNPATVCAPMVVPEPLKNVVVQPEMKNGSPVTTSSTLEPTGP